MPTSESTSRSQAGKMASGHQSCCDVAATNKQSAIVEQYFVMLLRDLRNYNCFIRWVLILSRASSRIDPMSDARCTGRQHSKKHSQSQLLLNEIRDLHANVPCCSDPHSPQQLTTLDEPVKVLPL